MKTVLKTDEILLKYAVYCLEFGCCSCPNAALKISILGATATLAGRAFHCQWKEVVFIVVLASMNLTECHRMAIPEDPMCGLHVVRKGYGHQANYNFIEEAETGHRSSLFKGLLISTETAKK